MRKAIVIMATTVAFLLSGQAFAVRQPVNVPLEGELLKASTVTAANGTINASKVLTPVNITVGTKSVPVPVTAVRTIPSTNVSTVLKNGLKTNLPSLLLQGTVMAAVAGVGWVMSPDNTTIQKQIVTAPAGAAAGIYYGVPYSSTGKVYYGDTKAHACSAVPGGSIPAGEINCWYKNSAGNTVAVPISQYSCSSSVWFNPATGGCDLTYRPYGYVPITDDDYSVLDGFVKGKDGVWQRDLATSVCDSLPNPEACYASLPSSRALTGPSVVTAPSSSTSTSTSTTSTTGTQTGTETSTKTETPTATITYGDTYFDYSPITSTTTTTTNNNGTSTSTETSDIPTVPDALAGINDPLGGLPGIIQGQGSSISPLGYHSWFSMGGSCKEHTFELPVIGPLTTNYCPIHEAYVRPFLAFMFALWTFHYCFQIWRESVTRVRAD